jgi:hypothetical protein
MLGSIPVVAFWANLLTIWLTISDFNNLQNRYRIVMAWYKFGREVSRAYFPLKSRVHGAVRFATPTIPEATPLYLPQVRLSWASRWLKEPSLNYRQEAQPNWSGAASNWLRKCRCSQARRHGWKPKQYRNTKPLMGVALPLNSCEPLPDRAGLSGFTGTCRAEPTEKETESGPGESAVI